MMTLIQTLEISLPLLYAAIFFVYLRHFRKESKNSSRAFIGSHLLYGVLGVHIGYLVLLSTHIEHIPVASRAEFLSVVALCVGIVYAFAERKHGDPNTGIFFIALTVATQTWSSWLMEPATPPAILEEYTIYGVHVLFMVFGFTALAISALYAMMYILLSRQLKSRNLGVIFRRLPSLNILEQMSRLSTLAGILFLGVGLASGHFLGVYLLDDFNFLDPKIIIAYIAWTAYAAGFLVVKIRGLSGLRMAYLSMGGYAVLIASMVFVNTFLPTFHSFQ